MFRTVTFPRRGINVYFPPVEHWDEPPGEDGYLDPIVAKTGWYAFLDELWLKGNPSPDGGARGLSRVLGETIDMRDPR